MLAAPNGGGILGYGSYAGNGNGMTERALREEFVRIGQLMHMRSYVTATDGNLSARIDSDRFLVTPSGLSKGHMTPDQMVVIDWNAKPVAESKYGPARSLSHPPKSCCTSRPTASGQTSTPSSTPTRSTPSRSRSPASRWRAA